VCLHTHRAWKTLSPVATGEFISRTGEETYAVAIYIKGILIFSDFTFTLLVILWQWRSATLFNVKICVTKQESKSGLNSYIEIKG
jgi:hypothetical protein